MNNGVIGHTEKLSPFSLFCMLTISITEITYAYQFG